METENQMGIENQKTTKEMLPATKTRSSQLTIKGLIIAFLILLLLIPTFFITNLVNERLKREESVRKEVCSKWASNQTLTGPILVIPYLEPVLNEKKEITDYKRVPLYFLPETLDIQGEITPYKRYRSIFEITVYQSNLTFAGKFPKIDILSLGVPADRLLLKEAHLYFNMSDFRGIEEQLRIKWEGNEMNLNNEMTTVESSNNGLVAPIELTVAELSTEHSFSLDLKIKGSENLMFIPIGKTTTTHLKSTWTSPSFIGNFLPNNPAEISDKGFTADWKILHLNRNFPQYWSGHLLDFTESEYGVKLLKSADSYSKTERSIKYAILFISLTFALYFFIEILQNKKVHPIQYVLVGMALCIFYVLLLSISEYAGFNWAYLIASGAIILLITWYTKSAFGKWSVSTLFGCVLASLYGFIFILIQLQDGALLFGSIGLFILLAVVMYYSRKIDWYGQSIEK